MADTALTMADVGWTIRPYQQRFLDDGAKTVAVVKARQIGMSEAAALLAVLAVLASKTDVWLLATNLSGAKELLRKCSTWLHALSAMDKSLAGVVVSESTESITLSNGSRITALPCTRAAVRGKTGTVIWDEAAWTPDDREIWTAIAPIITSNPNLRMILVSTPNGDQGVFSDAVHGRLDSDLNKWSVHHIDVDMAVREGFSPEVYSLRSSYTADAWEQEFKCSFLAVAGRYYPPDLVSACLADGLVTKSPLLKRVLSIDLASKQDSSVALYVEHYEDGSVDVGFPIQLSTSLRRATYPQQREQILGLVNGGLEVDKIIVDAAGPGAGLAQQLTADLGRGLVIEHTSTATWKAEEIPALKAAMEGRKVHLARDPSLILAFQGVKETRSSSNNILYSLARDDHGHSDAFSAALMGFSVFRPRLNPRLGQMVSPAVNQTKPATVLTSSKRKSRHSFSDIFKAR